MNDRDKTKEQLVHELIKVRQRIAELEAQALEHPQTEEALIDSQRRFWDLYENAPNAYFSVTVDGLIHRCNRQAGELLGYATEELVGRPLLELYADTPHGKEKASQVFERFRDGAIITDQELQMQKADGTPVWISLTVNAITDVEGRVVESRSMVVDITARKDAEAAQHEREKQLHSIFSNAAVGIALMDMQERFIGFNDTWRDMLGYGRDELLNLSLQDISPVCEPQVPYDSLSARWKGDKYLRLEKRFNRKDGSEFWGDLCATFMFDQDGNPDGMIGIIMEITERVRAEQALERHNLNLALLNQVSQALIATPDLPRIVERLLRAAAQITAAEGSLVWLWDEERAGELACQGILFDGESRTPYDVRLRPGQGIPGWVAQRGQSVVVAHAQDDPRFFPGIDQQLGLQTTSLLAVPLQIRDHISGVLQVVNKQGAIPTDAPPGFDAEDHVLIEMLAASATAAIDNARLIESLRQYGMELEARNQELDEFAHSVAHDLKNPLGQVVGFADLLEKDYAAALDQDVRQSLRTIAQTGRKMSNIIDELLLLAGVRRKEKVELLPLDMASIVTEAQRRLADLIQEHQVAVILPPAGDWPAALGYGPWIEEVWVNYLSNAIQYGGRPPRVEVGATEQSDGTVRFWVRDNGDGLTPLEQARLFKSFERLDRVRAKGHGLGLSIVRRIVEKLGGKVGVESEKGVGSIFSFTLPPAAP
jgi:PAS domain S-box-containing protein